jgi:hypothetical protein
VFKVCLTINSKKMKVERKKGVRRNIYLTENQNEKLLVLSKKAGLSVSSFIRLSMMKLLAKKNTL